MYFIVKVFISVRYKGIMGEVKLRFNGIERLSVEESSEKLSLLLLV